ncbi:MAG TPA: hypothetical protein VFH66_07690 [Mycobacteriales bacterium]|nr:hypothetical protein [Mycobacteriales bacterium]
MTADPWRAPDPWHVTASAYQPPAVAQAEVVRWPHDALVALLTATMVTLTGAVVGLIWSATAPKLSLRAVVAGSEATFKSQIGADGRFLFLGLIAGVICAGVVVALGERGPGAVLGLAVGGVLAALVANRVGVVAQQDATLSALRSLGIPHSAHVLDLVGFRVRAQGVLLAWPIAALVVHGLVTWFHPSSR